MLVESYPPPEPHEVIQREVANCIIEGARNARGGDRIRPQASDSLIDLFEAVAARP